MGRISRAGPIEVGTRRPAPSGRGARAARLLVEAADCGPGTRTPLSVPDSWGAGLRCCAGCGALWWRGWIPTRAKQPDAAMIALQEQNRKLADALAERNVKPPADATSARRMAPSCRSRRLRRKNTQPSPDRRDQRPTGPTGQRGCKASLFRRRCSLRCMDSGDLPRRKRVFTIAHPRSFRHIRRSLNRRTRAPMRPAAGRLRMPVLTTHRLPPGHTSSPSRLRERRIQE